MYRNDRSLPNDNILFQVVRNRAEILDVLGCQIFGGRDPEICDQVL